MEEAGLNDENAPTYGELEYEYLEIRGKNAYALELALEWEDLATYLCPSAAVICFFADISQWQKSILDKEYSNDVKAMRGIIPIASRVIQKYGTLSVKIGLYELRQRAIIFEEFLKKNQWYTYQETKHSLTFSTTSIFMGDEEFNIINEFSIWVKNNWQEIKNGRLAHEKIVDRLSKTQIVSFLSFVEDMCSFYRVRESLVMQKLTTLFQDIPIKDFFVESDPYLGELLFPEAWLEWVKNPDHYLTCRQFSLFPELTEISEMFHILESLYSYPKKNIEEEMVKNRKNNIDAINESFYADLFKAKNRSYPKGFLTQIAQFIIGDVASLKKVQNSFVFKPYYYQNLKKVLFHVITNLPKENSLSDKEKTLRKGVDEFRNTLINAVKCRCKKQLFFDAIPYSEELITEFNNAIIKNSLFFMHKYNNNNKFSFNCVGMSWNNLLKSVYNLFELDITKRPNIAEECSDLSEWKRLSCLYWINSDARKTANNKFPILSQAKIILLIIVDLLGFAAEQIAKKLECHNTVVTHIVKILEGNCDRLNLSNDAVEQRLVKPVNFIKIIDIANELFATELNIDNTQLSVFCGSHSMAKLATNTKNSYIKKVIINLAKSR